MNAKLNVYLKFRFSSFMVDELWDDIPSDFYIAIGRRGQESIDSEQCFLKGCNNKDSTKLHPLEKSYSKSEPQDDGSYYEYTQVKMKCDECGGIFHLGLKVIYPPSNIDGKGAIMGMANALDENGEDLGFIGYF
jgi:hypothetical protein